MESQIYDWSFKKVDVDQVTINHYKVVKIKIKEKGGDGANILFTCVKK